MTRTHRGRLHDGVHVPATGERHVTVTAVGAARVEEILSGDVRGPLGFLSEEDEWVVLLAGTARVELDGEEHLLTAGDWMLIPAGTPHTLHQVEPGTRWLAVHSRPRPLDTKFIT